MFEGVVPGLVGDSKTIVTKERTAKHLGSGGVSVFATPEMIRLMEIAAVAAADGELPQGYRTVGVHVNVQHLAPTPLGMTVRARATLEKVDGRRLTFKVEAWDDNELIGTGSHERAIINVESFGQRARAKRPSG